jgi:hypothetical protein
MVDVRSENVFLNLASASAFDTNCTLATTLPGASVRSMAARSAAVTPSVR